MKNSVMKNRTKAILSAALFCLAISSPSWAHVLLDTPEAPQGTFYKAIFRVPHGCHGAATTSLKVDIPEGLIDAKPMPKPGWTITTTKGAYKKAYTLHHKNISQGVTSVTWNGGNLPDDEYDEFVIALHVADSLTPGSIVYFSAFQTCGSETIAFTDIPQAGHAGEAKMPAPGLRILAGAKPAPAPAGAGSMHMH
jgi:uncharacterized protein YcnI